MLAVTSTGGHMKLAIFLLIAISIPLLAQPVEGLPKRSHGGTNKDFESFQLASQEGETALHHQKIKVKNRIISWCLSNNDFSKEKIGGLRADLIDAIEGGSSNGLKEPSKGYAEKLLRAYESSKNRISKPYQGIKSPMPNTELIKQIAILKEYILRLVENYSFKPCKS